MDGRPQPRITAHLIRRCPREDTAMLGAEGGMKMGHWSHMATSQDAQTARALPGAGRGRQGPCSRLQTEPGPGSALLSGLQPPEP